jgi:ankyrin repeat protein
MISKTSMLALVKELRWQELRDGLDESPGLIAVRDKRGRNWLHLACGVDISKQAATAARDSIKVAEILLSHGVDVNDPAFTEGDWKATPLWYAIAFGRNLDLARYLLKHGSDPNHCLFAAAYNNDTAAIRLLSKHGAEIDPEAEGATPFLFAVQWSRFEAAEELLKLGANANYQDSKGMTALHYMLKKGTDKKYVRMILQYAARGDIKNKEGLTAAAIMMRKRDPGFQDMAAPLLRT